VPSSSDPKPNPKSPGAKRERGERRFERTYIYILRKSSLSFKKNIFQKIPWEKYKEFGKVQGIY